MVAIACGAAILLVMGSSVFSIYLVTSKQASQVSLWGISAPSLSAALPLAVILGIALFAYLCNRKRRGELTWAANQVYFLGYLCTIIALVSLVFFLGLREDGFDDTRAIAHAIGIALTTTIAGLVGMIMLRGAAHVLETKDIAVVTGHIQEHVRHETEAAFRSINNLGRSAKKAGTAVDSLGTASHTARSRLAELDKPTRGAKTAFTEFSRTAEKLAEVAERLTRLNIPKDVIDRLPEALRYVASLGEAAQSVKDSLGKLRHDLDSASESTDGFKHSLDKGTASSREFRVAIDELDKLLLQIVDVSRRLIEPQMADSPG